MLNDYECRYIAKENRWFVLADTQLSLPPSELKKIGERIRRIWLDRLRNMDGVKESLKMSYIRKALQALENNQIAQVWRAKIDG